MASVIRRRSLLLQVLWLFLTFGLYLGYWFYSVSREMSDALGKDEPIGLLTLLLLLPPISFYSYYKQGELFEQITKGGVNRWMLFALWLVFPPAAWIVVQLRLNEIAASVEAGAVRGANQVH